MILAAGLTPAWQQVLRFDAFTPGTVNRAAEVHWCASGKVLNAATALHHLGGPYQTLTVVGGTPGDEIRRDCARRGIAARWVASAAATRVCTTIVDASGHTCTELVENARPLSAGERDAFLAAYVEEAAAAAVVVLIGSLPAGTPPGTYRDLLARTPGKVVLDARGEELLQALEKKPFLVKPNREELGRTVGRELRADEELFDAMREIIRRGAEWVVVTDGRNPIHACSQDGLYRIVPPSVEVVNPIGCGDCMAAGIAWAIARGQEPLDALRYGVAVAADKLGRLLPGEVDLAHVEVLARAVTVIHQ